MNGFKYENICKRGWRFAETHVAQHESRWENRERSIRQGWVIDAFVSLCARESDVIGCLSAPLPPSRCDALYVGYDDGREYVVALTPRLCMCVRLVLMGPPVYVAQIRRKIEYIGSCKKFKKKLKPLNWFHYQRKERNNHNMIYRHYILIDINNSV